MHLSIKTEIDLALIMSFWLVVFCALQWHAVKKQGDQNLFAMRINHYKNLYKLCDNLILRFEHFIPEHITNDVEMEKFEKTIMEIENYIDESMFLFNNELFSYEKNFTEYTKELFKKISGNQAVSKSEIEELKDLYYKSKNFIEIYLHKRKP